MLSVYELELKQRSRTLLSNLSFELNRGQILGLVAPNGLGKTTLLRTLAGHVVCRSKGSVEADGVSPHRVAAYRKLVFYAPGDASLLHGGMSVLEHLKVTKQLWGSEFDEQEVAKKCNLFHALGKPSRTLSKGMKQQLNLAIAYMTNARYVLLDEPMNALDPSNLKMLTGICRHMAKEGRGVIVSSHLLGELDRLCDSVAFLTPQGIEMHACNGPEDLKVIFEQAYGDREDMPSTFAERLKAFAREL